MPMAFLCCLPLLCAGVGEDGRPSYLIRGDCGVAHCEPYLPQAGDLVFFDRPSRIWDLMDWIAGTQPPDHMGIVVVKPDGSPALFEAGPDATHHVFIMDAIPRLHAFKGPIYVRRLRCPLSSEQSCAADRVRPPPGRETHSILRLARQITPLRTRGPVRTKLFAATITDRRRWICSEIVIAAGTVIGLFDPKVMPGSAIYGRDVLDDRTYDLSCLYEPYGRWSPCPIDADAAADFCRLRSMFTKPARR